MKKAKIAIIDFKLSNLFSVAHACEYVGLEAQITSDPKDLKEADALILPGVGAFADALKNLDKLGLTGPILEHINQKKPFMGVCLGLQLLFETSEEFGMHKGLGVFKGKIIKFPNQNPEGKKIRVPHIGWDKVAIKKSTPFLKGFKNQEFMYFVHSYFALPLENDIIAASTNYEGIEFVSAVSKDNVFAVQFHPEKSGKNGPLLYRNFSKLI
jgi:imidazole glycerol-phosphate synthase subunit HisH